MEAAFFSYQLTLADTFTIARSSRTHHDVLFVRIRQDGFTGWGEASPNQRYGESLASSRQTAETILKDMAPELGVHEPDFQEWMQQIPGQNAAKAALDMAFLDWFGKSKAAPVHRLWQIDPQSMPATSMTIGIDSPEHMAEKAKKAAHFPALKIKVGTENDRDRISAIRAVSSSPLRVDANEAWMDREQAIREIEWLATQNVKLVEQPMPGNKLEDAAWLKSRSPLPLFADEAFYEPEDLLSLHEAYHGVNIKLMKCGGLQPARKAISMARKLGMSIMLGCMLESSLAIAAAAQIAPLVDVADLDGNLLVNNDPFQAHALKSATIMLSNEPGLGAKPTFL